MIDHDRHEGRRAIGPCRGQMIELLDLRKTDIYLRLTRSPQILEHVRQAMQRLRPEDQIDERRTRGDPLAFLTGDAAADADDHLGALLLEKPPFSQQRKHLFLGFFTHRAGIDQQQVGLRGIFRADHSMGGLKYILHLAGVVLVHLAAECLYVYKTRHVSP
jgi:hypothetical protein